MTIPKTTITLGTSRSAANRASRVRASQRVLRRAGNAPAVATLAEASVTGVFPAAAGRLDGGARREGLRGRVQRALRTGLAEQRLLDLDLQFLGCGVVVGDLRAQAFSTSSSAELVEDGFARPLSSSIFMNSSACTPPPVLKTGLPEESRNFPPKAPTSVA